MPPSRAPASYSCAAAAWAAACCTVRTRWWDRLIATWPKMRRTDRCRRRMRTRSHQRSPWRRRGRRAWPRSWRRAIRGSACAKLRRGAGTLTPQMQRRLPAVFPGCFPCYGDTMPVFAFRKRPVQLSIDLMTLPRLRGLPHRRSISWCPLNFRSGRRRGAEVACGVAQGGVREHLAGATGLRHLAPAASIAGVRAALLHVCRCAENSLKIHRTEHRQAAQAGCVVRDPPNLSHSTFSIERCHAGVACAFGLRDTSSRVATRDTSAGGRGSGWARRVTRDRTRGQFTYT
jgi:hypothetical protein